MIRWRERMEEHWGKRKHSRGTKQRIKARVTSKGGKRGRSFFKFSPPPSVLLLFFHLYLSFPSCTPSPLRLTPRWCMMLLSALNVFSPSPFIHSPSPLGSNIHHSLTFFIPSLSSPLLLIGWSPRPSHNKWQDAFRGLLKPTRTFAVFLFLTQKYAEKQTRQKLYTDYDTPKNVECVSSCKNI